jgi:hypothetical protein
MASGKILEADTHTEDELSSDSSLQITAPGFDRTLQEVSQGP